MNFRLREVLGVLRQMVENEEYVTVPVMLMVEGADALTSNGIHLILSTMDSPTIVIVLEKVRDKLDFGLTITRAALMDPMYRPATLKLLTSHPDFDETYVDEQTLVLAAR